MRPSSAFAIPELGLLARPIEREDAVEWFAFAGLPQVKEHTSSTVATVEDLLAAIDRCNATDPSSPVCFSLRRSPGDTLVGTVGFHTVSAINRTAEITYEVDPSHWGRGIASLACQAAVSWAFSQLRLVRVQATALDTNVASQRVLTKCGFLLEGTLRNFRIVRGEPRNYLLYATIASQAGSQSA
jgi:RimJ/RimL family protein N-acetyltransferase